MFEKLKISQFAPRFDDAEFQKSFLFKILLPLTITSEAYNTEINCKDEIQYCTSSTNFPTSSTTNQAVAFYNSELKIATKTTYAPWQVTFKYNIDNPDFIVAARKDGLSLNIYQYFDYWRNATFWETDRISSIPNGIKGYKKTISLILLNDLGEEKYEFKLEGAWPSSLSGGSLNYAEDAIVTFNVEFTFDRYVFWTAIQ